MMQSQGLGALMPQGAQQMAPQQPPPNPQRLAAATNLVSSDAERQILDPRTLAMLKYKDALQAMQAADQMMAAAQPTPTPPTVAERTKLAAEQGIAGLASRLSPGIQQQGNNMQAQQLQQAMSGGLPQLPAPNMAGMAQGGVVGFQEGGDVEKQTRLQRLTQQLIDAGMEPEAALEEARSTLDRTYLPRIPRPPLPPMPPDLTAPGRALVGTAGTLISGLTPEAFGGARTEDFGAQTSTPMPAAEQASERPFIPSTGYGTGVLDRRTGQGRSLMEELGSARDVIGDAASSVSDRVRDRYDRPRPTYEPTNDMMSQAESEELADFISSYQPSKADQLMLQAGDYAIENPIESAATVAMAAPLATAGLGALGTGLLARRFAPSLLSKLFTRPNPQMAFGPVQNARVFSPVRTGATTLVAKEGYDYLTGEGEEQPAAPAEQASAQTPSPATATAAATAATPETPAGQPMSDVDRLLAQLETEVGGTAPAGDQGFRMRGVGQPGATTAVVADSGLGALRDRANTIRDRNLDPDFVENTRLGVERRAREAYGIPQETRDLYQSRIDALDRPMFTPAEERSRKLRALLSGLASSNVIAEGGPAASRAVAEVSDAIREDSTARAEKQFELAASLMDKDMQASQQAFTAGLDATTTAMNQQGVALQMAISTLTAADNREAAAILQQSANRIESLKIMIEAAQNGQVNAVNVQRNVGGMIRAIQDDIISLRATALSGMPLSEDIQTSIRTLENSRQALEAVFNAALGASGYTVPEVSSDGGGGQSVIDYRDL
jgi:hypothetical protein